MTPEERAFQKLPIEEQKARRKLGEAMMHFVQLIMHNGEVQPDGMIQYDDVMRRHDTEVYRQAVEEAAAGGFESSVAWHSLAVWTESGKERIGYFCRALAAMEAEEGWALVAPSPQSKCSQVHMHADCLHEIGRIHAHEGDPAVAREFLLRALPLAQEAEQLRELAGIGHDDRLEGRIAALLVQLPDESDLQA